MDGQDGQDGGRGGGTACRAPTAAGRGWIAAYAAMTDETGGLYDARSARDGGEEG